MPDSPPSLPARAPRLPRRPLSAPPPPEAGSGALSPGAQQLLRRLLGMEPWREPRQSDYALQPASAPPVHLVTGGLPLSPLLPPDPQENPVARHTVIALTVTVPSEDLGACVQVSQSLSGALTQLYRVGGVIRSSLSTSTYEEDEGPAEEDGYTVEVGGQTFTRAQWEAAQTALRGTASPTADGPETREGEG